MIDTKVQTWTYRGGYTKRYIDLGIDQEGNLTQTLRSEEIAVPANAADSAITARIEGWEVPIELRALVQVTPDNAPFVVASVGTIEEVENKILTPAIRGIVRNVTGAEGQKVLNLIEGRDELENQIELEIAPEGAKAGVTIKEVRFGEPAIPPELMVARLREQLANQLMLTYQEEKKAQDQRIETEKAKATADQQGELVKADIEKQAAEFRKDALQLEGEGEKLKLLEIAEGQKAQVDVLGEDKVMQLAMLEKILEAAVLNPEIVKVPSVLVTGANGGLEGAAAVLGNSNLLGSLKMPTVATPAVKP